jgi:hypothetical protein
MAEPVINTKPCTNCKEIKEFDQFYKNKERRYGLHSWCNECVKSKKRSLAPRTVAKPGDENYSPTKQCSGECGQIKNLDDFTKNKNNKDGLNTWCKECFRSYIIKNKERVANKQAANYIKNRERLLEKQKVYNIKHKEELAVYKSNWNVINRVELSIKRAANRQKNGAKMNAQTAEWKRNNPGKVNASSAKRKAQKLLATPSWLTESHLGEMQNIYIQCSKITKETGIQHHVDHIEPLLGKEICGLHVPWNLQILIGPGPNGNCSKGNRRKKS